MLPAHCWQLVAGIAGMEVQPEPMCVFLPARVDRCVHLYNISIEQQLE
jgi:hypothetical protein